MNLIGGDFALQEIKQIPESFLYGLRPSLLLGKFRFFETFLANPGKLIQNFFRNFSFSGHKLEHITGKLIRFLQNLSLGSRAKPRVNSKKNGNF